MFDIQKSLSSLKKIYGKRDIFIVGAILLGYLLTRLIRLDQFPIFSDEGIYLHWAKIAWHDASWRFISLTDGKQPLQTWGTIPFLKLFPDNALLAGRLFSVSTGLFALTGVFVLLYYLFGKKTALIGSLLYVFTPYFLFYDRMALVDSGVNAFFIWILFFSVLLINTLRLDVALVFGMLSGLALLAKSSVKIFVGLAAFSPVLIFQKNRKFVWKTVNFAILFAIVVVLSLVIYNIQRLSPFLHFVSEKNKTFILTFDELAQSPFLVFFHNLKTVPLYAFWESGFVLPLLGFLGLFLLYKKDRRMFVLFCLLLIVPYLMVSFVSRVLFPRYIIFFGSLFLILASYFLAKQKNKSIIIFSILLYVISVGYFDYAIIVDYKNIPFPPVDRGQYVEGWSAGWGAKEIMQYARDKSQEKPVRILAEGDFGLAGDVLDTFLKPGDKISIKGYWPLEKNNLIENQNKLSQENVYIVFSHRNEFPSEWPMKMIKKYEKPGGESALYLFELTN